MAYSLIQINRCIFHLTHVQNVSSILKNGILSKNQIRTKKIKINDVSHENIQDRRANILIPETNISLHDCVPMFLGARPPMLYAVIGKGFEQKDMVYVIVDWNIIGKANVWYTNGNASSRGTNFFHGKIDLKKY
ncbi:MAG: DUF4433 domain-containing protein [Nitrospirae bacterium]|nr:DUF4433 domain-containing protein [Nitrospirota bacterium]